MEPEPDYRAILLSFIASLTLCEHMGDVSNDICDVLKLLGIELLETDENEPEYDWPLDLQRTLHKMGVKTLLGTEIGPEGD